MEPSEKKRNNNKDTIFKRNKERGRKRKNAVFNVLKDYPIYCLLYCCLFVVKLSVRYFSPIISIKQCHELRNK